MKGERLCTKIFCVSDYFRAMEDVSVSSRIGTLHTREVIDKYKAAGADMLVMMFLTTGVPLFLKDLNVRRFPRGRFPNNNSAKSQSSFVSSTLVDWESRGFIERVPLSEVKCLLPLSVADRWSHSKDTLKYRLGVFSYISMLANFVNIFSNSLQLFQNFPFCPEGLIFIISFIVPRFLSSI